SVLLSNSVIGNDLFSPVLPRIPQAFPHMLGANRTLLPIMVAGGAVLSSEVDDLQMCFVPFILGDEALQITFRLFNTFSIGQAPSVCQPVDVRVYGEGRLLKD